MERQTELSQTDNTAKHAHELTNVQRLITQHPLFACFFFFFKGSAPPGDLPFSPPRPSPDLGPNPRRPPLRPTTPPAPGSPGCSNTLASSTPGFSIPYAAPATKAVTT